MRVRSLSVRNRERGASAVEFALVLPVLLAVVFGIIQFGVLFSQQVSLNSAVRNGARFGSVNAYAGSHTCGAVVKKVRDAASTVGMSGNDVAVEVTLGTTTVCDSNAGGSLPGGDAPCVNPSASVTSPDVLNVTAEFHSEYLVPLPVAATATDLSASGSYQCEYNK